MRKTSAVSMSIRNHFGVFSVIIGVVFAQCPHDDTTLLNWNDGSAWQNGQAPNENGDVVLTGRVLLNTQPPTLHHLTIASGAELVFDPDTDVHLRVHAIYVEGGIHIGSESCLFDGNVRVTFLGDVNEDKVLLVKSGGTLEVHGRRKLPWTKLAQTAPKLEKRADVLEGKDNLDLCNDECSRGLIVYELDPSDGSLIQAHRFDFVVLDRELQERIDQLRNFIEGIPNGHVIGIGMKKQIVHTNLLRYDLTGVFEAIERLFPPGTQTLLRGVDQGSAYALLTVKGRSDILEESFLPNSASVRTQTVTVTLYHSQLAYVLESEVRRDAGGCWKGLDFRVYDDVLYRPTITLLDDVSTWRAGDKLIMASTDYSNDQEGEVTIMSVVSSHELRLTAPLKYTHFGQIYKGVDMRGEVGLLTRNVKFDSEEASTSEFYGGHIKVLLGFASVHIEGAELEDLGQQEILGSYSIHFHMCEDVEGMPNRPWIRENSIHHTNSRCVTIHNTMGVLIQNNVCYKSVGHGYFLEDGSEQNNVFDGNLGLGTEKPPTGRGLIPTDISCPATFWITNPKNYYRNNVAAGGDCMGFWFNYPDVPLLDVNPTRWMKEREARFTAIYQFDNNVGHSNREAGLFIDNILKPNGESEGYNKYRPVKNPVENNCMENDRNCEDECVHLKRFTGYKNNRQNAWIRGGCIYLEHSSLSDSLTGIIFLRDNLATQSLEKSVVLGDSFNTGEPEAFLPADGALQRSFPFGGHTYFRNVAHVGAEYVRGPVFINSVWFGDFQNTQDYYKMGAIGFRQNDKVPMSPRNTVTDVKFGFNDPTEGNRVFDYEQSDPRFSALDGDDTSNFRDYGSSVSGVTCSDPKVVPTVVRSEAFHLTSACQYRENWNMALCCHNYGQIIVRNWMSESSNDQVVTMVRDDDVTAAIDSDIDHFAPYNVILGGEYSYSMFYNDLIPTKIRLMTSGVTNTGYLRFGICLPPHAVFDLQVFQPTRHNGIAYWTRVTSLAELDSAAEAGKYFYHEDSGYFAAILRNKYDFLPDERAPDPKSRPVFLIISIISGDRSQTKCLEKARTAIGDLSPKASRNVKRRLHDLLRRIRHKRQTTPAINTQLLQADSASPPSEWGAGSSHVQWNPNGVPA